MEVHGVGLRERQCLTDEAGQTLAEGVVEALDMVGETGVFADRLMLFVGDDVLVGPPEVGVDGSLPVAGRNRLP